MRYTLASFVVALQSHLTQHDRKLAAKERTVNIYRLGHYLAAAAKVAESLGSDLDVAITPDLARRAQESLARHFIARADGTFDLPPVRKVAAQLRDGSFSLR